MELKAIHDQLLSRMPEGSSHDSATCQLCSPGFNNSEVASENQSTQLLGGGAMDKTHTEEDVKAAVAVATAALISELDALKVSVAQDTHEAEIASAVETAVATKDGEIKELQAKLDTAVLESEGAKRDLADLVALIEDEKTRAEREAELNSRRDERLDAVRAVASFPDEYMTANADRWAALSDEDFEALCEDYKAVASKDTAAHEESGIPRETAMLSEREQRRTSTSKLDATKEVLSGTLRGINWNSL